MNPTPRAASSFGMLFLSAAAASLALSCTKPADAAADAGVAAAPASQPSKERLGKADPRMGAHGAHGTGGPKSALAALPATAPVLKVGDTTFTRADLDRTLVQHAVGAGFTADAVDDRVREAFESPSYEKLIERELLRQEAERRGLKPSPDAIALEKAKLEKTLPPGKTLQDVFAVVGGDVATFERDLATDVAIAKLFQAMKDEQPKKSAAELRKIYDDNKAAFLIREQAEAHHILVRLGPNATPDEVAAAEKKIAAIDKEVRGKDIAAFEAAAVANSEDPTAKLNKGNLGVFARGDMLPAFDDAAFKLKKGELSKPVRTSNGLHLIRLKDKQVARQRSFDEMKDAIAEREQVRSFMAATEDLLDELRKKAKIERLVEPLPSPLPPAPAQGSRVPSWRPTSGNAMPGTKSPH